jgi:hypothetical protein
VWDLSLSCNSSSVDASLIGCKCSFAAELLENGLLSCDDATLCPQSCPVCRTCLSILGCSRHPEKPLVSELVSSKLLLYLIVAVAALVVIMLAAYHSQSRRRFHEDLEKSLIEEENILKSATNGDLDNYMYIIDDFPWKPTSPEGYSPSTIQPFDTMNTSSTSRHFEENERPQGGVSLLGEIKPSELDEEEISTSFVFPSYPIPQTTSALDIVDITGEETVSPISSPGGSDAETESVEIFEDDTDLSYSPENMSEDDGEETE